MSAVAKIPPKPAKPSKDTVYVDLEDEITAIIDKVETSSEKIVALVLPKRATVLQSTVNMRLLARNAKNAGKSVVLITSDPALLPLAGIAGLHTAKNLHSKPVIPPPPGKGKIAEPSEDEDGEQDPDAEGQPTTLDYHRSIGELAALHALDEPETIDMDGEQADSGKKSKKAEPADKKLKIPDFDRFRLRLFLIAGAGVMFLVFLVLAIFVLPKATIIVKTNSVPVSTDFSLTTSDTAKALDEKAMVIPASLKTSDQTVTQQVQATGQQNNGEKATGTITLTNCTDNPRTVPAGTGVSSSGFGLTFITQSSTSLDAGDFTSGGVCKSSGGHVKSVSVTAQTGGAKYNIGASSFTVTGYSGVSGNSSSSMAGGTDNITAIVSQSDVDKVKQQITSESSDKYSKEFQKQLDKDGLYALSPTLKLSDPQVTSTPAVGQPASTAKVTVKVTYTVLTVKKDDLRKVVTSELEKQIDKNKQKLAPSDVLSGLTIDVANQTSPTVVTLNVSQTASAVPIIDTAAIKKLAAGQKTSTIKQSLSGVPGVKEVQVNLSPFWVSKAPKSTSKITVVQTQDKTSQNSENP